MDLGQEILCIISNRQRRAYCTEFDLLRRAGVGLVFETCPDQALEVLESKSSQLVIVGIEIGWTQGREFLARLARCHPLSKISIVLLPDKEDPHPSLVHSRDPSTGLFATQAIEFDQLVASLIESAPHWLGCPKPQG